MSQQGNEAFLGEVIVVREDVGDAFQSHRLHRDAVSKTVLLVGACLVKGEPGLKQLVRLWCNTDTAVRPNLANASARDPAQLRRIAESGQEFAKHLLGGNDLNVRKSAAHVQNRRMPLITLVSQRDPVEGIREHSPHSTRGLGVP